MRGLRFGLLLVAMSLFVSAAFPWPAQQAAAGGGPPGDVVGLSATPGPGPNAITLTWEPPASDGGSPILGYTVYAGTQPGSLAVLESIGTDTTYLHTDVPDHAVYHYQVAARNANGEGTLAPEVSSTTILLPSAPRLLVAAYGVASAGGLPTVLSWQPPADLGFPPVAWYSIHRSTDGTGYDPVTMVSAGTLTFTDTLCTTGHTCSYVVFALGATRAAGPASNEAILPGGMTPVPTPLPALDPETSFAVPPPEAVLGANALPVPVVSEEAYPVPAPAVCEEYVFVEVPTIGQACQTIEPAGWNVLQPDGSVVFFSHHDSDEGVETGGDGFGDGAMGPSSMSASSSSSCPSIDDATGYTKNSAEGCFHYPRSFPMCSADPVSEPHLLFVYAYPTGPNGSPLPGVPAGTATMNKIRLSINAMNGQVQREAWYFYGERVDFRFQCDNDGKITIVTKALNINNAGENMGTIKSALAAAGVTTGTYPNAKFLVYYDDPVAGACGQGDWDWDPTDRLNNVNNNAGDFAMVYRASGSGDGTGCLFSGTTGGPNLLHEFGHALGAVQAGGAWSSWPAAHCYEGADRMCGPADPPAGLYAAHQQDCYSVSPTVAGAYMEQFDCKHDTYFAMAPPAGNYLSNHWNIGRESTMKYLVAQSDCGIGNDASSDGAWPTAIAIPAGPCGGHLSTPDTSDWFSFPVSVGDKVYATLRAKSGFADFDLCLYPKPSSSSYPAVAPICNYMANGYQETVSTTVATGYGTTWRAQVFLHSSTAALQKTGEYDFYLSRKDDCLTGNDVGGAMGSAFVLTGGVTPVGGCRGTIGVTSSSDLQDWYKFSVGGSTTVRVSLDNRITANYNLCLYKEPTTTAIACSTEAAGKTDRVYHLASAGNYLAQVLHNSGNGGYRLTVAQAAEADCGTAGDAPATTTGAKTITPPVACNGLLTSPSATEEDWYRFNVATAGTKLLMTVTPSDNADINLCLYNPAGSFVQCQSTVGKGTPETIGWPNGLNLPTTGYWVVHVYRPDGLSADYRMVTRLLAPHNDCGTAGDAGDNFFNAKVQTVSTSTTTPTTCNGIMSPGNEDTADFYKFNVPSSMSSMKLRVKLTAPAGTNLDFCLYKPTDTATPTQCGTTAAAGGTECKIQTLSTTTTGDWHVSVLWRTGTAEPYTLEYKYGTGSSFTC